MVCPCFSHENGFFDFASLQIHLPRDTEDNSTSPSLQNYTPQSAADDFDQRFTLGSAPFRSIEVSRKNSHLEMEGLCFV